MSKKFYQKAVITNKFYALVILEDYLNDQGPEEFDCALGGCFVIRDVFEKGDKVDISMCYLIDSDLYYSLFDLCDGLSDGTVSIKNMMDTLLEGQKENIGKYERELYNLIVGDSSLKELIDEDMKNFKRVDWYLKDSLFKKFAKIASEK